MNEALTATDLAELERMLSESGIGNAEDVQKAKEVNEGLGLFVRSLIGLDREAAKRALGGGFLAGRTLGANQIEFLNLIIDHLTEHGSMEARLLYDSPYTDFSPRGVDGVFESKDVDELVLILDEVRRRAVGRFPLPQSSTRSYHQKHVSAVVGFLRRIIPQLLIVDLLKGFGSKCRPFTCALRSNVCRARCRMLRRLHLSQSLEITPGEL